MQTLEPAFGVYVHWPFCAAKCPYCDFNSHVRHNPVDQPVFVEAYRREIAHMASIAPGREVTSIFFGGGTPSLMEPGTVDTILEEIAKAWPVNSDVEITLEANPSSVDASRFQGYRSAGVNRVSLGVQSLNDDQLKFLGRLHNVDEARKAIELARENFPRMSFDMIYARPDQTPSDWQGELLQAIDLAADHLSLYQLTIEQGTPFFDLHRKGRFSIPDENIAAELYELTQSVAGQAGFETYEISNHAKPGSQCRHNLVYWRGQEYAGIGPGAHGRLHTNRGRLATATLRNPESWWQQTMVEGNGIEDEAYLDREEHADELILMGLRLAEGFDPERYHEISGQNFPEDKVRFLEGINMIEKMPDGKIRATPKGFLVLDAVVADLASTGPEFDPISD
ncbi:MAG: radical SAM family heme chaperone HemW [Rhizobiaceae bacterium]